MPLNRTSLDQPSDAIYEKTLRIDDCSCAPYIAKAEDVIRRLEKNHIPYLKPTPHGLATSNSVTYTVIQDLGIKSPNIPIDVGKFLTGWGVYLY